MKTALRMCATLLGVSAITAPAWAQSGFGTRPTVGIFGGVTLPRGNLGQEAKTGWHAGALAKIRLYQAFDARIDGTYSRLGKENLVFSDATVHSDPSLVYGTLSAVLNLGPDSAAYPGDNTITPYLTAGGGAYHLDRKLTCTGSCSTFNAPEAKTRVGLNAGAGANIPLGALGVIAEARYHRISFNTIDGGSRSFVTASVGLRFR